MSLTLNQFLFLVITIAAVVAVTFLGFLFTQLRRTAKEGEKTLEELRNLTKNLDKTSLLIRDKINDVDDTLKSAKKAAIGLSETAFFLTKTVVRPSSKYWPILASILNLGWRQFRKRKKSKE